MATDTETAKCSRCGATAPREDMFGLEPELLCEACSTGVRRRLAPKPVGRLANAFGGKPTPATTAILAIAVALFVVQHFVYRDNWKLWPAWLWYLQPVDLLHGTALWTGDWWRLITSALIHGGAIHILFNGILIWSLGRAVESTRGTLVFLLIFVASAAVASAAQAYFARGWGVGLSGVLYALAGYLWMRRREDAVAATVLNPSTARLLGVWFVLCWFLPLNIGNWAHAGGLVWGLAAGWISTQPKPGRYAGYVVLAIWTVLAAWYVSSGHRL